MRKSLTGKPIIVEDVEQIVVLSDYDSPVAVAYHQASRDTIIAGHAAEDDFQEHLNTVGSLAGVKVPLIKPTI